MQFMDQRSQCNLTSTPDFGSYSKVNAPQTQEAQYRFNLGNTGYRDSYLKGKSLTLRPENMLCNRMQTSAHSTQKAYMAPSSQYGCQSLITQRQNAMPRSQTNTSRMYYQNGNRVYLRMSSEGCHNNTPLKQLVHQVRNTGPTRPIINDALSAAKNQYLRTTNLPTIGKNSNQGQQVSECQWSGTNNNIARHQNVASPNNYNSNRRGNFVSSNVKCNNFLNKNSNNSLPVPVLQPGMRLMRCLQQQYRQVNKNAGYNTNNGVHPNIIPQPQNTTGPEQNWQQCNSKLRCNSVSNAPKNSSNHFLVNHGSSQNGIPTEPSFFQPDMPNNLPGFVTNTNDIPIQAAIDYFTSNDEPNQDKITRPKSNKPLHSYVTSTTQSNFVGLKQGGNNVQSVITSCDKMGNIAAVPPESTVTYFPRSFPHQSKNIGPNDACHVASNTSCPTRPVSKLDKPIPVLITASEHRRTSGLTASLCDTNDIAAPSVHVTRVPHQMIRNATKSSTNLSKRIGKVPHNDSQRNNSLKPRASSIIKPAKMFAHTTKPVHHNVLNQKANLNMTKQVELPPSRPVPLLLDPSNVSNLEVSNDATINNNGLHSGHGNLDLSDPSNPCSSNESKFRGVIVSPKTPHMSNKYRKDDLSTDPYSLMELLEKMETAQSLFEHLKASFLRKCILKKLSACQNGYKDMLKKYLQNKLEGSIGKIVQIKKLETRLENLIQSDTNANDIFCTNTIVDKNKSNSIVAPSDSSTQISASNLPMQFETDPSVMLSALTAMNDIGINMSCFSDTSELKRAENAPDSNSKKQREGETFPLQPVCESTFIKELQTDKFADSGSDLESKYSTVGNPQESGNNKALKKVRLQSLEEWYSDISDTDETDKSNSSPQPSKANINGAIGNPVSKLDRSNQHMVKNCEVAMPDPMRDNILNDLKISRTLKEEPIRNSSVFTMSDEKYYVRDKQNTSFTEKLEFTEKPTLALKESNIEQIESNVQPMSFLDKIYFEKSSDIFDLQPTNTSNENIDSRDSDSSEPRAPIILNDVTGKYKTLAEDKTDEIEVLTKNKYQSSAADNFEDKTPVTTERKLSRESESSYLSILSVREGDSLDSDGKETETIGLPIRQSTPELSGEEFIADSCLLSDDENIVFEDSWSGYDALNFIQKGDIDLDISSVRAPTLQDTINKLEKRVMSITDVPYNICHADHSRSASNISFLTQTEDSDTESCDTTESERFYTTKRKYPPQKFTDENPADEFNFAKKQKTNSYNNVDSVRRASSRTIPQSQTMLPQVSKLPHKPLPYHKKAKNAKASTQHNYYLALRSLVTLEVLSTK